MPRRAAIILMGRHIIETQAIFHTYRISRFLSPLLMPILKVLFQLEKPFHLYRLIIILVYARLIMPKNVNTGKCHLKSKRACMILEVASD